VRNKGIVKVFLSNFIILAGIVPHAHALQWSSILSSSRAVDWTQAGIPNGIPTTRTQCGTTIAAGASTSTIQSALNSCASAHPLTANSPGDGGYVLLGAGTFSLSGLSIPSNVTLRGAGADQTIISETGTSGAAISMVGNEPTTSNYVTVTGGSGTVGSQSVTVSSASGFKVGQFMYISQADTGSVTNVGGDGTCTWCDGFSDGNRHQGQIVQITSVSGTSIGFAPGLYVALTNTPEAIPFTSSVEYAGLESLQLYANNTGNSYNVQMDTCAFCWVAGIEGNYVDGNGNHVEIEFGFRDEIRDSYFSDAYNHTSGSTENEIQLEFKTSNCKIENNILERMQTSVNLQDGSVGNVVAYNYMEGGFDQSTLLLGGTGGTYTHGPNSEYNLWEGNVVPYIYFDSVWGSSSGQVAFRNWGKGTAYACNPLTGRGTVTTTCSYQTESARSLQVDALSTNDSFVGNVLGSAEQSALSLTKQSTSLWPVSRGWDTVAYSKSFGYGTIGDSGTNAIDSANAYSTALFSGNYDNIAGAVDSTCSSMPASFYLSSQPSWWRTGVAYPAVGCDITGGGGPGGHTSLHSSNSAMDCFYNVMGGTDGGAGGPYKFNSNACYYGSSTGSGSTPTPPAPSGLSAVAQ